MVAQFLLHSGAGIRVSDADYHPFRSFPSQTKIAEMFKMKWLKTAVDHAKWIGHSISSHVTGWPGQIFVSISVFQLQELLHDPESFQQGLFFFTVPVPTSHARGGRVACAADPVNLRVFLRADDDCRFPADKCVQSGFSRHGEGSCTCGMKLQQANLRLFRAILPFLADFSSKPSHSHDKHPHWRRQFVHCKYL